MGSFFKKHSRIFHPASKSFMGKDAKDGTAALQEYGRVQGVQGELGQAEKDYNDIPIHLRDAYMQSAVRGGTYGNTPEFQRGLESEVQAGARGARVEAAARINALRKSIGNQEEFKPEGFGGTQGNVTQEKLKDSPAPQVAAPDKTATSDEGTGDESATSSPNSVTTLQNQRKLALQRAVK